MDSRSPALSWFVSHKAIKPLSGSWWWFWISMLSWRWLDLYSPKKWFIEIVSGWWYTHPSEKYYSQLGWLFPIYIYIWKNKKWSKPPTRMVLWSCLKKNRSTRKKQRTPIKPATFHQWHINSAGTAPASPWPCPSRGRACETARQPSSALGPGAHGRSPARKVSTEIRLWANLGQGPAIFWTPPHGIWWSICGRKQEVIKMDDVRGMNNMAFNMAYQFEKWLYVPAYELQTTYKKLQLRMVGEFSNSNFRGHPSSELGIDHFIDTWTVNIPRKNGIHSAPPPVVSNVKTNQISWVIRSRHLASRD